MWYTVMMTIKAVVCLVFAPILLFFPEWFMNLLGSQYGSGTAVTARAYGAALVGNLVLTWLARKAEDSKARRAIIWSLFIYDAAGFISMLVLQLQGTMNYLGWGIMALYLLLAIGFATLLAPKAAPVAKGKSA